MSSGLFMAMLKMSKRQPFPPCEYCARDCKDENVTSCSQYASRAALRARRW